MAQLKWYSFRAKGYGSIMIKGVDEETAREEAAERWNCSEDEIVCIGHEPYNGGRRLWY